VNGLGACTLIDANLLRSMQDPYSEIPSLKRVLWGEDRWFCTKLNVMGVPLHASTYHPPFHVYRPVEQLEEARRWYEDGAHPGYFRKYWLTAKWEEAIRKMY
jgi:hypothetical protein